MQNNNSEFDLQIKAMMEAAEVPAPAGAWNAISARLDAAAAPVVGAGSSAGAGFLSALKSRPVWAWASASLAMAAALAVGIFLFVRGGHSDSETYVAESVELVAPEVTATEPAAADDNTNLLADNTLSKAKPEAKPVVEQKAEASAEPVAAPVAAPAAEQKPDEPAAEQKAAEPEQQPATQNVAQPDPFAQMAMEDALKAKKSRRSYSAYVDGSFTTNNAGARPGAYGVSASSEYTQTGVTETSKSSYGLPLSVGAGVRFHLNDRLAVGAGVDYSLLTRTFKGDYVSATENVSGDIRHTMQYLGVPVNLYVKLLDFQGFHLYSFAGAEAEYGITNKFTILESAKNTVVGDKCHGMQYSAALGLGIEFKLGERLGLYVDPSARYYFDCRQPKSIRTEKPFLLMFDAGLRFNL
ncbi:MAG: PorT family protein [Bacteroidales bacterium]|nr:PorT family protein [Bacteroidales bacterium]